MKCRYAYSRAVYLLTAVGLLAELLLIYTYLDVVSPIYVRALLLLGIVLLLVPVFFFPRAFSYDAQTIRLHLPLGSIRFTRSYYVEEVLEKEKRTFALRLFGSGGYFGFTGFFYIRRQGVVCCLQATERTPLLRLTHRLTGRVYQLNLPPEALADFVR